jgi:hypothetical protein
MLFLDFSCPLASKSRDKKNSLEKHQPDICFASVLLQAEILSGNVTIETNFFDGRVSFLGNDIYTEGNLHVTHVHIWVVCKTWKKTTSHPMFTEKTLFS